MKKIDLFTKIITDDTCLFQGKFRWDSWDSSQVQVLKVILYYIYVFLNGNDGLIEIEREQQKELKSTTRDLDRELRTLTIQEQKLVFFTNTHD